MPEVSDNLLCSGSTEIIGSFKIVIYSGKFLKPSVIHLDLDLIEFTGRAVKVDLGERVGSGLSVIGSGVERRISDLLKSRGNQNTFNFIR